jgi:RNA polymerase sigma-70 factor (ECF subfamily)
MSRSPYHEQLESTDTGGDVSAETLVRDNIGWMLALSERLLGDRSLAEDVVQEALILALRGLDKFKGDSTLKTWLHRITANTAISKLRKLNRLKEESIDEFLPEFDRQDCRIEQPWTSLVTTEEVIESDETTARVRAGIFSLPVSYRVVLMLRDIEGYDTSETAKLLDISVENVKVRVHRARAALKKILEPVLRGEVV